MPKVKIFDAVTKIATFPLFCYISLKTSTRTFNLKRFNIKSSSILISQKVCGGNDTKKSWFALILWPPAKAMVSENARN